MTLREKNKEHIKNKNTLRNKLLNIDKKKKCIVLYKQHIVGIGTPDNLIKNSSLNLKRLLNHEVKEIVNGVSTYLTI